MMLATSLIASLKLPWVWNSEFQDMVIQRTTHNFLKFPQGGSATPHWEPFDKMILSSEPMYILGQTILFLCGSGMGCSFVHCRMFSSILNSPLDVRTTTTSPDTAYFLSGMCVGEIHPQLRPFYWVKRCLIGTDRETLKQTL